MVIKLIKIYRWAGGHNGSRCVLATPTAAFTNISEPKCGQMPQDKLTIAIYMHDKMRSKEKRNMTSLSGINPSRKLYLNTLHFSKLYYWNEHSHFLKHTLFETLLWECSFTFLNVDFKVSYIPHRIKQH